MTEIENLSKTVKRLTLQVANEDFSFEAGQWQVLLVDCWPIAVLVIVIYCHQGRFHYSEPENCRRILNVFGTIRVSIVPHIKVGS